MTTPATRYQQVLTHLDSLGMFHMELGLERMERGLRALDLLSPPYAAIQVVGTNGKGSTSSFLASLGKAHGVKTGLFTSPHMASPRERIRINGETLSEKRWVELAGRVFPAAAGLTYFECLCLMAALAFAEEGARFAVMEAGLGGRSDATTALPADLVCFTPIDLDHVDVLGPDLRDIVLDKAGAMRENVPAISARQLPETRSLLMDAARRIGCPLTPMEEIRAVPEDWKSGLRGAHQRENAALALAAWTKLALRHGWPLRENMARDGIESAFIPGRLQSVPREDAETGGRLPDLLLDGAHNAHAFKALRDALRELGIQPRAVIFSCLADKDLEGIAPPLLELAADAPLLIPPVTAGRRAADPERIAARLGASARAVSGLEAALEAVSEEPETASPRSPVLVCGSLYLLAEFFTLHPKYLRGS